MRKFFWIVTSLVFLSLDLVGFSIVPAYGIPAFARKYQTSCATCHVAFPKLNAFGESYRRNGFQFPEGTDLEYIKGLFLR